MKFSGDTILFEAGDSGGVCYNTLTGALAVLDSAQCASFKKSRTDAAADEQLYLELGYAFKDGEAETIALAEKRAAAAEKSAALPLNAVFYMEPSRAAAAAVDCLRRAGSFIKTMYPGVKVNLSLLLPGLSRRELRLLLETLQQEEWFSQLILLVSALNLAEVIAQPFPENTALQLWTEWDARRDGRDQGVLYSPIPFLISPDADPLLYELSRTLPTRLYYQLAKPAAHDIYSILPRLAVYKKNFPLLELGFAPGPSRGFFSSLCNPSAELAAELFRFKGQPGFAHPIYPLAGFGASGQMDMLLNQLSCIQPKMTYCPAQTSLLIFHSDGSLYSCYRAASAQRYPVGAYLDKMELDREELKTWRQDVLALESCRDCAYRLAGGGCCLYVRREHGTSRCGDCKSIVDAGLAALFSRYSSL